MFKHNINCNDVNTLNLIALPIAQRGFGKSNPSCWGMSGSRTDKHGNNGGNFYFYEGEFKTEISWVWFYSSRRSPILGQFQNGRKNGLGIEIWADGYIDEGYFLNNTFKYAKM